MPTSRLFSHDPVREAKSRRLLLRAALAPPGEALRAFGRWRRREAAGLAGLGTAEKGLLPLLSARLPGFGASPEECAAGREAFRETWAANHQLVADAAPAIAALKAAGLPVLVLKGAALAFQAYESPGLRPMRDVDLLVPSEGAGTARAALEGAGWTPTERHGEGFLGSIHGLSYRGPGGFEVDLHWHALLERPLAAADRVLFERAVPLALPGAVALAPAPEAHLLLVSVHSQRWSAVRHLVGIADAVVLLGRSSLPRLLETVTAARRLGLLASYSRALAEAESACPGAVPEALLRELSREAPPPGERVEALLRRRAPGLLQGLALHWFAHRRETEGATGGECLRSFPLRLRRVWGVPPGRSLAAEALRRSSSRLRGRRPGS